jgi:hypothetical protein
VSTVSMHGTPADGPSRDWNDDQQLLADLVEAVRAAGQVPERFIELGQAAFAWRGVDAELAALTFDSAAPGALDSRAGDPWASELRADELRAGELRAGELRAGELRASPDSGAEQALLRSLAFAARGLAVELEVGSDALYGQLVPPTAGEVEVRMRDGSTSGDVVSVDELGWFVIRPRPAGLFSLRISPVGGGDVITEWTAL